MKSLDQPRATLASRVAHDERTAAAIPPAIADPRAGRSTLAMEVAQLHSFDLREQPVVRGLEGRAGHLLVARTTVALRRDMIGRDIVVLRDREDAKPPIIMGVIEPAAALEPGLSRVQPTVVTAADIDGERRVIEAEREITLRCGAASITLTRAGKVVIEGAYILSRSSGYNKIKGAAVDIN